jgi:hypothetical protein
VLLARVPGCFRATFAYGRGWQGWKEEFQGAGCVESVQQAAGGPGSLFRDPATCPSLVSLSQLISTVDVLLCCQPLLTRQFLWSVLRCFGWAGAQCRGCVGVPMLTSAASHLAWCSRIAVRKVIVSLDVPFDPPLDCWRCPSGGTAVAQ